MNYGVGQRRPVRDQTMVDVEDRARGLGGTSARSHRRTMVCRRRSGLTVVTAAPRRDTDTAPTSYSISRTSWARACLTVERTPAAVQRSVIGPRAYGCRGPSIAGARNLDDVAGAGEQNQWSQAGSATISTLNVASRPRRRSSYGPPSDSASLADSASSCQQAANQPELRRDSLRGTGSRSERPTHARSDQARPTQIGEPTVESVMADDDGQA